MGLWVSWILQGAKKKALAWSRINDDSFPEILCEVIPALKIETVKKALAIARTALS